MKKKQLLALSLAALLALSACGKDKSADSEAGTEEAAPAVVQLKEGVLALVNDKEIKREDYNNALEVQAKLYAFQMGIGESITNQLVNQEILKADLDKNKVTISDEEKTAAVDEYKAYFGDETAYENFLKSAGLKKENFEKLIKDDVIYAKHKEWYQMNHVPSDETIQSYYEANKDNLATVNADHILVATEEEAKAVKARLDAGEDFAKLAAEVSTDSSNAANGGSLGDFGRHAMVEEFDKAVFSMEVGQISQPIKTEYGWHIIKLNAKQDKLEDVKETIISSLIDEEYNAYVDQLVASAVIQIDGQPLPQETPELEMEVETE